MTPISPVLPREPSLPEIVFAKNQPQYIPLPAVRLDDGMVITRWSMTWRERLTVLWTGSLWLNVLTFNSPIQPVKLSVVEPKIAWTDGERQP